ncbi:helix-turn-helix transcriptional regulator [Streptomyces sp. NBC_00091]|uniref:helix-turn-helix domain-containing protein n=1 Tax=Streptomyces sp. NBC_00091 TaxID=2975648 RepID=UPI00224D69F8|nr:helix-turn-helix transcriptional regulator [Streptomyces sp. NBC_00091]MCX5377655.1 helix-turn-helix domain-containing protein [Streptomyces sp. NBC_00091]
MTGEENGVETVGPLLRRLRREGGRTQEELAADLSARRGYPLEQATVSRWENEERLPDPASRALLSAEFGVPEQELKRAVQLARRLRRQQPSHERQDDEEQDVERREFISVSAGAAIQPSLLLRPGRRLGADVPRHLAQRTARLRRLDDFMGGGDTYLMYARELSATTKLVGEGVYTEGVGRELQGLIAEQAQLAGWAAYDTGMYGEARSHYMTALAASKAAGARSLEGNSLAFLAYLEWATGGRAGVTYAQAGWEMVRSDAHPVVRALLADRLAWQYAMSGRAQEADYALSLATEAIHAQAGSPAPDWAYWVDHDEILIMTGRCWTELHRPLRAIPALEDALGRYDDTRARDKALYMSWLASAYLDAGEVEHATAITSRVLDLSAGLASTRPAERIRMMLKRLESHRALAPVGALLERTEV